MGEKNGRALPQLNWQKTKQKWSIRAEGVDGSKVGGSQHQAPTGLKGAAVLSAADRSKDWPDISLASS